MNRILRFSLVCLLAVFCGSMNAQVWQEDWSAYKDYVKQDPNDISSNYNYVFTVFVLNEDGSVKSGTCLYDDALAGGETPELLIAKGGGTFSATISVPKTKEDLTLTFKCNKKITVEAEGGEVGELTNTGNDYSCTISPTAAQITLTFNNTLSQNCRLDNIKLVEGTPTTKPAGLSWGTSARTVTIGAQDNNFPTLQNENQLDVTYSSSDESVATIDASGEITLVAAGKTTITASFAGNDEFEAGEASYELTVKESGGGGGETETDISVADAWTIIDRLNEGQTTTEEYNVTGTVKSITEINTEYGNAEFVMYDPNISSHATEVTAYRCKGFNNASITNPNLFAVGDVLVVHGKLQKYKDKEGNIIYEMKSCYIVSINGKTEDVTPPSTETASSLADLKTKTSGTVIELTLTNAVVVKSWTSNNGNTQVFVRENGTAVQFYNIGFDLSDGDVLNGKLTATYKIYNNNPEFEGNDQTNTDNLQIGASPAAPQPKEISIADAKDNACDLVHISNVAISTQTPEAKATRAADKFYAIDDSDNYIQLYNGFHDENYDDLTGYVRDTYGEGVKGIVVMTRSDGPELYIIAMDSAAGVGAITIPLNTNAPIYNMGGQRVSKAVKGVYIQDGKKFVVK